MIYIYTLCQTIDEALSLVKFIMSKGYEGVQNDSLRYCRLEIEMSFMQNIRHHRNYIFVGANGYRIVVGTNKRAMRKEYSLTYVEKERIFKTLFSNI